MNNEVYLGKIRWRREPTKRIIKDGMLSKKRVLNRDYELYDGLREPIIEQEEWNRVKEKQRSRGHSSVNTERKLMNPFSTILVCEKCGAVLKRNVPAKNQNTAPWYRCPTRGCKCRAMKCDLVEKSVVTAMEKWLAEYKIKISSDNLPQTDNTEIALSVIQD